MGWVGEKQFILKREYTCRRKDVYRKKKELSIFPHQTWVGESLVLASNVPGLNTGGRSWTSESKSRISFTLMEFLGQLKASFRGKRGIILAWRRKQLR